MRKLGYSTFGGKFRCRVGAPDHTLTGSGGMVAVTELVEQLGVLDAPDAEIGQIKQRERGFSGGELLLGLAQGQLAGAGFFTGLDRLRADGAGQQLFGRVAGLASTRAAGLARRFTPAQWRSVEVGLARVHERMLAMLSVRQRVRLCAQATIDLDATDIEEYGRKNRGVEYNYQGQRCGRAHVATWAECETTLAADLLAGDKDPRAGAAQLLRRELTGLLAQVRSGHVRMRADARYFAGELARAANPGRKLTSSWRRRGSRGCSCRSCVR